MAERAAGPVVKDCGGESGWRVHVDTGGTFTDCLVETPEGEVLRTKVLSRGSLPAEVVEADGAETLRIRAPWRAPDDFPKGFVLRFGRRPEVTRTVASYQAETGRLRLTSPLGFSPEPEEPVELLSGREAPILAAELALARRGRRPAEVRPSMRLATTRCTNALLEGKGSPPVFFVTRGFRDLLRIGDQRRSGLFDLCPRRREPLHAEVVEVPERLNRRGEVVESLDLEAVRARARELRKQGAEVAAVSLLHSYLDPVHEDALATCLREEGFEVVVTSASLRPFAKWLPRAESAVVEAYLNPVLRRYLDAVEADLGGGALRVMTSAGGLVGKKSYRAVDSLLSGPAGGVVGAAKVARRAGLNQVLALDMGGTSTDVSRFDGDFDYRERHRVGEASVSAPALKIETVAAGGGSICRLDGKLLTVGPDSSGARPGPACYGFGGPLCLTDVNLLLGRLSPERFAAPVFPAEAERRLEALLAGTGRGREETLRGFLEVADDLMAGAIRKVSVREGYDPADYALVAFGGAGGQHACGVAEKLGASRILSPADAGLLSAYGLSRAAHERIAERQYLCLLAEADLAAGEAELAEEALSALAREEAGGRVRRKTACLRFRGQEATLEVDYAEAGEPENLFQERYRRVFGYLPEGRPVELVSLRVIASVEPAEEEPENFPELEGHAPTDAPSGSEGYAVHPRDDLSPGIRLSGPAIVPDSFGTLVLEAGWRARVGDKGSLLVEKLEAESGDPSPAGPGLSASGRAERELFANRFLTLVEEMGAQLERTALSTNVKERLDFSCALLDAEGRLTANAPHVPVHLGALGTCVRRVAEAVELAPGDVVLANHPAHGGSHLPDLTVVAPVHDEAGRLFAYVANRAHHAEVGGIRPGSMSPEARNLREEGVVLPPVHLFKEGRSRVDEVMDAFSEGPWPSRRPDENLADLLAQVASARRGVEALVALAGTSGSDVVGEHMRFLRERSARICGDFLRAFGDADLRAEQRLDDGSPIVVTITIREGRATFDFTGTAPRHPGNLNATEAVTRSALVYVLRLLAETEAPLNEGFLDPVRVLLPEDSLLAPRFPADPAEAPAVSGGNVEVSQRLVDCLLLAFGRVACSQGTMNNVVFGDSTRSHYETVAGGAGAGLGFDGASGVHVHMTNTAITDPEILELRLPVRLERFRLREGSGGAGTWRGGDGVEREYLFEEALSLSLLTQRRTQGPDGLSGGQPGKPGEQTLLRADGSRETLPAVAQRDLRPGDRLLLLTPGGGGTGDPETLA